MKKAGQVNKHWKLRYFMLVSNSLYYKKDIHKRLRGKIDSLDTCQLCVLHHRPELENSSTLDIIPFVIRTDRRIWMLGFRNNTQQLEFVHHWPGNVVQLITEDWVLVQYRKKHNRWIRSYMVYIGSGDILLLKDGGTMELLYWIKVADIVNTDFVFDGAVGNGMEERKGKTVRLEVKQKVVVNIEFNSNRIYEKYKVILLGAMQGDVKANRYLKKVQQLKTRKKMVRAKKKHKGHRKSNSYQAPMVLHFYNIKLNQSYEQKYGRWSPVAVDTHPLSNRIKRGDEMYRIHSPLPEEGIPMVDMQNSRHSTECFSPIGRIVHRSSSGSFDQMVENAGFSDLHDELQNSLAILTADISRKQGLHLNKQVVACTQAIENLGTLISPRSSSHKVGKWYTTQPRGGARVRHWIHVDDDQQKERPCLQ